MIWPQSWHVLSMSLNCSRGIRGQTLRWRRMLDSLSTTSQVPKRNAICQFKFFREKRYSLITLQLDHKKIVYRTLATWDFLWCLSTRRWWRGRQCCHSISTEKTPGSRSYVIHHSILYEINYKMIVKYIHSTTHNKSHYSRKSHVLIDHSWDNCHRSINSK